MSNHRKKRKVKVDVDEDYYVAKPISGDIVEQRFKEGEPVILLRKGPNYGRTYVVRQVHSPQRKPGDRGKPAGQRTFIAYYGLRGLNHGVTDDELASADSFVTRLKQWWGGRGVRKKHTWVEGKGYIYGDPNE